VSQVLRVPAGDDVELQVIEVGDPDAPAVLLLHGVGSSSRFLIEAFSAPLQERGWRLLAADLRGHGASTPLRDANSHAHARHVEDVCRLVEHLGPSVIGGVSLGGHAAVGAAAAGVSCAAVIACLPAWSGESRPGHGPHAAVASEVAAIGIDGILERLRRQDGMAPWLREVLLRDWPSHQPASLAAALTALDGGDAPTVEQVSRLASPLALVAWPDDPGHPIEVARQWAGAAPTAHLEQITIGDLQPARRAMGDAAVRALDALGVTPT
jgi:pimeloyl-ACP methyl ester carboxylesterase